MIAGIAVVDVSYLALTSVAAPLADRLPGWMSAPYRTTAVADPSGDHTGLLLSAAIVVLDFSSEEFLWRGFLLP